MAASLALYVHFPYCLSICPYCDFDRQASGFERVDVYLAALVAEIGRYRGAAESVHSVFFGGGTPSLMRPEQVAGVLEAIGSAFHLEAGAEVTLEANPGDAGLERMRGFRAAGVNRLSLGVQSLDDPMLGALGRRHSADAARRAAGWARTVGFQLNLDVMYGLPGQTLEHWSDTLEQALELGPDHLSCYLLTLDERVPMGRAVARGELLLPEDETLVHMYELARRRLAAAGFEQYEISNWALPGRACRHNLTYWRDGSWIGVGAGAASSYAGRRWKNTPVVERYVQGIETQGQAPCQEDEVPDLATRALDYLTLGLRLREGVSLSAFHQRFGADLPTLLQDMADWLLDAGLLEREGDRLRIAADRQLLTNEILVRLSEPVRVWAAAQPEGAGPD